MCAGLIQSIVRMEAFVWFSFSLFSADSQRYMLLWQEKEAEMTKLRRMYQDHYRTK